jgi:hypothetical protein
LADVDPSRVPPPYRAPVEDAVRAKAQFAEQRLLNSRDELRERLPVLEARLATAVARAAELALTSPAAASTEIDDLAAELDRLVVELHSLSAAAAELA